MIVCKVILGFLGRIWLSNPNRLRPRGLMVIVGIDQGWQEVARDNADVRQGLNVVLGKVKGKRPAS